MMPGGLIQQFKRHSVKLARTVAIRQTAHSPAAARQVTWRALADTTARLAESFRRQLDPGDVLLMASPNDASFYAAFMAGLLADLCVLPVSPELTAAELTVIARHANARGLVASTAAAEVLAGQVEFLLKDDAIHFDRSGTRGDDLAAAVCNCRGTGELWLPASGASHNPARGQPIVRRSLASLDAVAANCVQAIGVTDEDAILVTLPLHHSYGLEHGLLMPLYAGASVEILGAFDLNNVMRTLCEGTITVLPGVPFLYESIAMSWSPQTDAAAFGPGRSLRCAYSAGGPLPRAIYDDFCRRFQLRIGQVFGSTELGSVTYADPHRAYDRTEAAGSATLNVGFPLPGVSIRVLDRDQPNVAKPLPAGVDGLIAIAASSMLSGFVQPLDGVPDDSHRGLVDGYYITGDIGRLDDDGALTIEQCSPCLINVGGRKVNPAEVQAVLMTHPDVRQATVVPTPVTPTVSRLRAQVQVREGATVDAAALRQHCRSRLSAYKVPRQFEITAAPAEREPAPLPRLAVGLTRLLPLLLVLLLWSAGCASVQPLPILPWPGTDEALAIISARAEQVRTMSARCDITIDPPDESPVRVEGAMVAAKPDRFRMQAWKLNQKLIDLTVREDGIWLWTDPRAAQIGDNLPAGMSDGSRFVESWMGPLLSPFDVASVEVLAGEGERDKLLTVRWPIPPEQGNEATGYYWRLLIHRPTLTIREMHIINSQGVAVQSVELDRYRMIDGIPWPTQWDAQGKVAMRVRMSEIELNPQLPDTAFSPPRQATRRP
jgi:acyl-CoA synthetase (AMP-forming)/AMP-acid ligase II